MLNKYYVVLNGIDDLVAFKRYMTFGMFDVFTVLLLKMDFHFFLQEIGRGRLATSCFEEMFNVRVGIQALFALDLEF